MQEQEKQTAKGRDLYEWVQSLVGSVLVVVAIFTFVIRMMGVDGHSMLNTLQHGDRLLVVNSMLYHDYKYGDIVILRKNGVFDDDPIVKRRWTSTLPRASYMWTVRHWRRITSGSRPTPPRAPNFP